MRRRQFLRLASAGIALSACTAHESLLAQPRSAPALFQNIKQALDRGLLLDEGCFTEANLKRTFGAAQIRWTANNPSTKSGELTDFGTIGHDIRVRDKLGPGFDFFFFWREMNGRRLARITVAVRQSDLVDFATIENIFGKNWDNAQARLPVESLAFEGKPDVPATVPYGNAVIRYVRTSATSRSDIFIRFFSNANLREASFEIESVTP
jgi:hypothetical protein